MKTVFKLIGLVCFTCSSLNAASFLVLIRNIYTQSYLRAEQWGGRYLVADAATYGNPELAFIIEDTWWGTPWLEAGDPFWIRSEMNNMYWSAGSGEEIRVNQPAPGVGGTEAFQLENRLDYGGLTKIKPNNIIWPNNYLYRTVTWTGGSQEGQDAICNGGYDQTYFNHFRFSFTILAVMQ